MWLPWERDRLMVFADELLARGDLLGERIAASLAAESCYDVEQQKALREHAELLDRSARDPHVDELIAALGVHRVRREYGLIVGLELAEHPGREGLSPSLQSVLWTLLGHRELAFVQVLEFPGRWFFGPRTALKLVDVVTAILRAELRPRVIHVVDPYQHHQVAPPGGVEISNDGRELAAARRGLLVFIDRYRASCLSRLGPRDNNGRAGSLAARIERKPFDPVTFTWFARAFWDDSLAVRRVAFGALDRFGIELAAIIPSLLLLSPRRDPIWEEQLETGLAALAQRPELVEAVAPALDLRKSAHHNWLAGSVRPSLARR